MRSMLSMHRQTLLATLVVFLSLVPATSAQDPTPEVANKMTRETPTVEHLFDHLVVGIAELETGVERIAELTGVRPEFGGRHPHTGTHNALAALGAKSYLEVVAPRPDADLADSPLAGWIAGLADPTPILWAVATTDAAATRALLEQNGFATSEPEPGSRATPTGDVLEWRTLGLTSPALAAAPFFIEWSPETIHPASTSPPGCRLTRLEVTSNDNETMERLLTLLGVEAWVVDGPQPALRAELSCPTGLVELGGPAG